MASLLPDIDLKKAKAMVVTLHNDLFHDLTLLGQQPVAGCLRNPEKQNVPQTSSGNIYTSWSVTTLMEKTKEMGTSAKDGFWATLGSKKPEPESIQNPEKQNVPQTSSGNNYTSWSMTTLMEKTKEMGTSAKDGFWATVIRKRPEASKPAEEAGSTNPDSHTRTTAEDIQNLNPSDSTQDHPPTENNSARAMDMAKEYGPYVAGAVALPLAIPVVVGLAGFGSIGIAAGSLAAICQSIGAAGMSYTGYAVASGVGVGAVAIYKNLPGDAKNEKLNVTNSDQVGKAKQE